MSAASRIALAVLLILGLSLAASGAHAGTQCVHYQVTGPVVGTREGSRCVPLPGLFDFPFSVEDCQGIPPIGFSDCVGADLHLFLP